MLRSIAKNYQNTPLMSDLARTCNKSQLSGSLINSANRVILSKYSLEVMNTSLAASSPQGVFFYTAGIVISSTPSLKFASISFSAIFRW